MIEYENTVKGVRDDEKNNILPNNVDVLDDISWMWSLCYF